MASAILARAARKLMRATSPAKSPLAQRRKSLSLEQHLRGIDDHRAPHRRELALPHGKLGSPERVFPADVVPVVDVERERHHLIGPEALGEERRQPVIGRRAGIAAFGGIQLDQRGRVRPGGGGAGRIGRARGARKYDRDKYDRTQDDGTQGK